MAANTEQQKQCCKHSTYCLDNAQQKPVMSQIGKAVSTANPAVTQAAREP